MYSQINYAALRFVDYLSKFKIEGIVGVGECDLEPCIYFYHKLLSDKELKQIPAMWQNYHIVMK